MGSGFRESFSSFIERGRHVCETVVLRTHIRKWERVAKQGPPSWDDRNIIIARFIPEGSSVIDLGSGAQSLKTHLKAGCRYQPCDVVRSSPDVIFCDFNRGIYPAPPEVFDFVVVSGCLEYVRKPKTFIQRVSAYGRTLLLSYNPRMKNESRLDRMAKHWVNHLTNKALERIFDEVGLTWKLINTREPNEYLYEVRKA
jgi:hypothetical protein